MDINIATYVNIYTYRGFYLPTYIFIHTYHPYVYLYTHTSIAIFTCIYIVSILSTHTYIIITRCVHTYTPISVSAVELSLEYTHRKTYVMQTLVLIGAWIFTVNGHNHRPAMNRSTLRRKDTLFSLKRFTKHYPMCVYTSIYIHTCTRVYIYVEDIFIK